MTMPSRRVKSAIRCCWPSDFAKVSHNSSYRLMESGGLEEACDPLAVGSREAGIGVRLPEAGKLLDVGGGIDR